MEAGVARQLFLADAKFGVSSSGHGFIDAMPFRGDYDICSRKKRGLDLHSALNFASSRRLTSNLKLGGAAEAVPRSVSSALGATIPSRKQVAVRRTMRSTSKSVKAQERDVEFDLEGEIIADDYYSILGLTPYASPEEIKKAYYSCMKVCHPDLSGNDADSVAFCQFVNEVYEVLSDPEARAVYDEIQGYSAAGSNPFLDTEAARDHAFVDEYSCIGCKNCANTAEKTFAIEDEFGRARVQRQDGNHPALVQEAIDTCPVNCIHWVSASQLALLEDEMRRVERVSVGTMAAGMGRKGVDVFSQAQWRWDKRQRQALERQRMRMQQRGYQSDTSPNSYGSSTWSSFWTPGKDAESEDEGEATRETSNVSSRRREKMAQAAAAARKWREYSRRGVDRKATKYIGNMEQAEDDSVVAR